MAKRGEKTKVGQDKSELIAEIPLACADEKAAVEFLERQRWEDGEYCPRCGSTGVYQMADSKTGQRQKNYRWRCRDCKKQYTVRTGTVMEDSRIPLRHWCYALWRACTSKKGVAALEIKRQTGLSYKSALFLMHRVRFAMTDMTNGNGGQKMVGTVEADETYVGGKPRNKGNNKRGRGTSKQPVMAIVQRGGNVKSRVIPDVTAATLKGAIRELVDASARVMTMRTWRTGASATSLMVAITLRRIARVNTSAKERIFTATPPNVTSHWSSAVYTASGTTSAAGIFPAIWQRAIFVTTRDNLKMASALRWRFAGQKANAWFTAIQ
jgi:transposase-like protein